MVVTAIPNAPSFADPDPNATLWCRGGLLNHRSKHPFGAEPRLLCRGEDRGDDGDDVGLVTEMRRWEGAGDMEVEMTRSGDDESGGGRLWSPELFAGKLFRQRRRKMIERKMEAVVEDMDSYHDEGMGDIIVGRPFLKKHVSKQGGLME
ncbi:hypothetical protein Tco_0044305 [Tanacetum coccineum]